jgi:hypothetical protein
VRITPKEPDIVQAQIAQFASEYVRTPVDRAGILTNLSNLAVGSSVDQISGATYQGYKNFLTNHLEGWPAKERAKIFRNRADIITAYDEFKPIVDTLRAEANSDYVAGGNSVVYFISHNDKEYAVRSPIRVGWAPPSYKIDQHIAAAALTRGLPHFEQVVAASYEAGVTVSEKIPGKMFSKLTLEDLDAITDEQLEDLVKTIQEADRLGLVLDFNPDNFLYDDQAGFGLIDLEAGTDVNKTQPSKNLAELIAGTIGTFRNGINDQTRGHYGTSNNLLKTSANYVIQRYKEIAFDILDIQTARDAMFAINGIPFRTGRRS